MKRPTTDLFNQYKDKIIALFALCFLVWLIFGSFLLFENYSKNLKIVKPQNIKILTTKIGQSKSPAMIQELIYPTSSYPVAVMIDNHTLSRPQSGLSQAQLVYETLVEGGATRFMAFFDVNTPLAQIGPVRSARPYFVDWASEYQALYVHAGGSLEALSTILKRKIFDVNEISGYGTLYFWRGNDFSAPHNLFTSTENLKQILIDWNIAEKEFVLSDFFVYVNNISTSSLPIVQEVTIDFSAGSIYDARFLYDQVSQSYIRYQGIEKKVDKLNNQPISVVNLIIQQVPTEEVLDSIGRLSIDIIGVGQGVLLQQGVRREINWKKNLNERTNFYNSDGSIIQLLPGLTWLVVVPGNREVLYK